MEPKMRFDSSLLHYFVRDAVRRYSENFFELDKQNPVRIRLNDKLYSVHASYVHDSGNARDNDDEVRKQIGESVIRKQIERKASGETPAFIAFFEGENVFVGWDPRHILELQANTIVSVYARFSQLEKVKSDYAATHQYHSTTTGNNHFAIALPTDALGFYLENLDRFHRLPSEHSIQGLMKSWEFNLTSTGAGSRGEIDVVEGKQREKMTFERTAYPRDPKFMELVLGAYEKTCCICGRQLGFVQAAHIIPHSEPDSPNDVRNGLALCVEHHRLYDDALLLPGPGKKLVFNPERAKFLQQTNQGEGIDGIIELSKKGYRVPSRTELQPLDKYLQRGLEIRLAG
jgi:putative restriction endonuclease